MKDELCKEPSGDLQSSVPRNCRRPPRGRGQRVSSISRRNLLINWFNLEIWRERNLEKRSCNNILSFPRLHSSHLWSPRRRGLSSGQLFEHWNLSPLNNVGWGEEKEKPDTQQQYRNLGQRKPRNDWRAHSSDQLQEGKRKHHSALCSLHTEGGKRAEKQRRTG